MKKFILFLGVALCAILCVNEASAQIKVGEEGRLSIAFESNTSYYAKDKLLEDIGKYTNYNPDPDYEFSFVDGPDRSNFGSNDYLKLDYSWKGLSVGLQVDGYLPPLYGYDLYNYSQRDTKLSGFLSKYIQWEDKNWGVRVGDIYDQFGNGLIFRTYEDRNLAFNNSLAGARAYYNFNNYVNVKVLAGMPRLYDIRTKNWVYGGDLSLSISDMAGWNDGVVSIEGSYVGRYDSDISEFNMVDWETQQEINTLGRQHLNMVSGRLNFEYKGVTLRGEYAAKLNNDLYNNANIVENVGKGNAIYVDLGYNYKRFSATATFRRLKNMTTFIDPRADAISGGNFLNYLPILTRQHTYSLAGLNPFMGAPSGNEIGGQIDLYYSLRNKKARGKYWNFHANFSMFNTYDHVALRSASEMREGRNIWLDFNFDVERQWNKSLKTTFFYSFQRRDTDQYDMPEGHYCPSHIFVADVTYKVNKKHSLRFEAQYLAANNYEGDWVAATIEYNFAPKFSVYVSDMWNCEPMKDGNYGNYFYHYSMANSNDPALNENPFKHELLHYYQVGASFTHNSLRVQLSYGRNREGIVCSGGVCRKQPAFTGANLALTLSF